MAHPAKGYSRDTGSNDRLADAASVTAPSVTISPRRSAWSEVSRYQWLVLIVAWLGWVFDTMDGTLFSLVQKPCMTELMGPGATQASINLYSGIVFSSMLLGWALGGLGFGILADYVGRSKTLAITILIYSIFTGVSALSQTWWHLAGFRFLTGLGLGGEWAAGAALVAEIWPTQLRAKAAAVLQSAGVVGYFLAAVINLYVGVYSWRYVYLVGIVPALLVFVVRRVVREPDSWTEVNNRRQRARLERNRPNANGSSETDELSKFTLKQMFSRQLRRDSLVGASLSFVVLFVLWGATLWIPSAIREIAEPATSGLSGASLEKYLTQYASYGTILLNCGAFVGCLLFGPLADRIGRRPTFFIYFLGGLISLPATFMLTSGLNQVFALLPLVGFFTLGVTSGFPIYLPELFPTYMRTTGVGFCYNLGRVVTAGMVIFAGYLVGLLGSTAKAASAVCLIFIVGMFILIFARETRGQRLM